MPRPRDVALLGVVLLSFYFIFVTLLSVPLLTSRAETSRTGNTEITRLVLLHFSPESDPTVVQDISRRFIAMKDACLSSTTQKPYIKTMNGGIDSSPDDLVGGITHAFIIKFASAADRDFFVTSDVVHEDFKKYALDSGHIKEVQVVDFENGVFS